VVALGLVGTLELWRGKRVVLQVGRTVEMSGDVGTNMTAIQAALQEALPPYADPGGRKPWPWLTTLLK
jgi:hypothetical protein